ARAASPRHARRARPARRQRAAPPRASTAWLASPVSAARWTRRGQHSRMVKRAMKPVTGTLASTVPIAPAAHAARFHLDVIRLFSWVEPRCAAVAIATATEGFNDAGHANTGVPAATRQARSRGGCRLRAWYTPA